MYLNDIKSKVDGKFYKEVIVEDDSDNITYVFPDTENFISIIKRKLNKKLIAEEKI